MMTFASDRPFLLIVFLSCVAISEELVRNAFFSVSTTTALNVEDSQNSLLVSIFIHIN